LEHYLSNQLSQALDDLRIEVLQHATESGDIGQLLQAQQAQDQRIVVVKGQVSEMAKSEQEMDHKTQHEDGVVVSGLDAQMAEATPQSGAQIEALKQCLEDDQAGERGELLIFESELRESS
jgi:hypothetical protein